MKPEPVRIARSPAYPTLEEIARDKSLLEKNIPSAWRSTAEITRLVALLLVSSFSACGKNEASVEKKQGASVVAPIFMHGDGRGATGCVVVSPPVFLSEEDAMRVIAEELSKEGVSLSDRNVEWGEVVIPGRYEDWSNGAFGGVMPPIVDKGVGTPLRVDGYDPQRRVGVEFVSDEEFSDLGGPGFPPNCQSSAKSYDFQETAGWVAKQVKEKGRNGIYFGTLYDPMSYKDLPNLDKGEEWEIRFKKLVEYRKEESLKLLRLQVKDFVDWLKAQGAL